MTKRPLNFVLAKAGGGARQYAAGTKIFCEGDVARTMYYLRAGSVTIEAEGKVKAVLEEGNLFGELSLIDGSPRSATATTKTVSQISEIDEKTFLELVQDAPYISLDIMRMLADRLREMNRLL